MKSSISKYFLQVEKPARYIGGEYNLPDMNKKHAIDVCLCFADVYEVGMSNLGVRILYDCLNKDESIVCQRCFAPWVDMGKILKDNNIPLASIECDKPLKDFDTVMISVPFEMTFTTILYMLDLAQIPLRAKDRDDTYPIIAGGGPISANCEPIADFFDVFFIGDGEEINIEFCHIIEKYKGDKQKILLEASKINGVYVPSLGELNDNGINTKVVKKAIVKDLDKANYPTKPLVSNMEIVHDRAVMELYRGCYAGCRFCQAGFFYRPIRYRESDTVVGIVEENIKNSGFGEVSLSSLSTGDYEQIIDVIKQLKTLTEKKDVVLQMPSMRLDSFTAEMIASSKKSSLTFAPEAGTQRLRNVINKNITDEDIEKSMRLAFAMGYRNVKLYFMLGLPTETEEDIKGIVDIVLKIKDLYREVTSKKDINIVVSTAMFIPKPMTPFQWAKQITIEEMLAKQEFLKSYLYRIKGVKYSWHSADVSLLEGVFARGDRKLSYVIESAFRSGAKFDGWAEHFNYERWCQALENNKIKAEDYTREYDIDEVLAWDYIDIGVNKSYLQKEYRKSLAGETTPPCNHKCNGCGANKLATCRQFGGKL